MVSKQKVITREAQKPIRSQAGGESVCSSAVRNQGYLGEVLWVGCHVLVTGERLCHPCLHLLISLVSKAAGGIFLTEVYQGELLSLTAGSESKEDIGYVIFEKHLISPLLIPGVVAEIEDTVLTPRVQVTM